MADFAPWLRNNATNDQALADLRVFAQGHAADWPYQSNNVDDYVQVIDQAAPANAAALKLTLYRYFVQWVAHAAATAGSERIKISSIALVLAGLVIAAFLIFGINNSTFLAAIAKTEQARGLMTFLFAIATTSVIIVVTIGVLWVPKDEIEVRFSKAKDIMTLLISVLGTILGFYFGSAVPQQANTPSAGRSGTEVVAPAGATTTTTISPAAGTPATSPATPGAPAAPTPPPAAAPGASTP